jgi:hypothetical protein
MIAQQLAAEPHNKSAAVSDSLHEIMDRVSKLVRDAEGVADEADTAKAAEPAPTTPAPAKKSAAV